ncbi:MAG: RNA methyltransferase [Acidobacteriota bacterium]|jgi:tRNA (guanosine-2'-O-)-methyltransferase
MTESRKYKNAWELLSDSLTPDRRERIRGVLANRTRRLVLVAENLYDPHNLSAMLRTADAFGIQYVHLAGTSPDGFNQGVTRGADQWVTVSRNSSVSACLKRLKARGYTLAATEQPGKALDVNQWEPQGAVALVMGNEHDGLSSEARARCDVSLSIPMPGFTQSLNVSVAAAVLLDVLLRKKALLHRVLDPEEVARLMDEWAVKSVPNGERLLAELRRRRRA